MLLLGALGPSVSDAPFPTMTASRAGHEQPPAESLHCSHAGKVADDMSCCDLLCCMCFVVALTPNALLAKQRTLR